MSMLSTEAIKAFKIGDIFYECEMGLNIEARVTSKPVGNFVKDANMNQVSWTAENTQDGTVINYHLTEEMRHYGPKLYDKPQYCAFIDGEYVAPLVGADKGEDDA